MQHEVEPWYDTEVHGYESETTGRDVLRKETGTVSSSLFLLTLMVSGGTDDMLSSGVAELGE